MRRILPLLLIALAITPPAAARAECQSWSMATVAEGFDRIENLVPDGMGGMLLSVGSEVQRLTRDGSVTTAATDMPSAGGLRVRGSTLFAVTGTSIADGLQGNDNGTIEKIDLRSGERTTYSDGLTMPNGLVFDRFGNAYVSRDVGTIGPGVLENPAHGIGTDMKITKISAADPGAPDKEWADLGDTNGLAVDASSTWLYAATTFNMEAAVFRVMIADPTVIEKVAELGSVTDPVNGLDDMTMGRDGLLYIAANGMGRIWSLDPETGAKCIIASGLMNPTAVKFGRGPGWPSTHLFVTGWDGRVRELTPPSPIGP